MARHHAPPVSCAVGRSFFLGGCLALVWGAALGANVLWWAWAPDSSVAPWLGMATALLCGAVLRLSWQRRAQGCLHWDGAAWRWQGRLPPPRQRAVVAPGFRPGCAPPLAAVRAGFPPLDQDSEVQVRLALDLQRWMLIRMQHLDGRRAWVWADAASDPTHWLDLRRAIHVQPHNEDSTATPQPQQP